MVTQVCSIIRKKIPLLLSILSLTVLLYAGMMPLYAHPDAASVAEVSAARPDATSDPTRRADNGGMQGLGGQEMPKATSTPSPKPAHETAQTKDVQETAEVEDVQEAAEVEDVQDGCTIDEDKESESGETAPDAPTPLPDPDKAPLQGIGGQRRVGPTDDSDDDRGFQGIGGQRNDARENFVGDQISFDLKAIDMNVDCGPLVWDVSGEPDGVTYYTSGENNESIYFEGVLSKVGQFTVSVTVMTSNNETDSYTFAWNVSPPNTPPTIEKHIGYQINSSQDERYFYIIKAHDADGDIISWQADLPNGVQLYAKGKYRQFGILEGRLRSIGSQQVYVQAFDHNGGSVSTIVKLSPDMLTATDMDAETRSEIQGYLDEIRNGEQGILLPLMMR